MNALPRGIIVATLTPYDQTGAVDLGRVREHAAFLVRSGIRWLAPAGTTGEFPFLSEAEKRAVVAAAVEGAGSEGGVIAGIWGASPEEVDRLAAAAEDAGARAAFLTTPIYYRYPEPAIAGWYRYAGAATRLPVFCYNIPAYSGNEISLPLLEQLLNDGVVAGIKDSTASEERLAAEVKLCRGRGAVYGASDSFALESLRLGADGFISALANIFPAAFAAIWEGDTSAQAAIDTIRSAVKGYGGIAALKHLLARHGFDFGPIRLPFSELDAAARVGLDRAVDESGLLER
jgi:4-hydroxy-tetrahydrodipicolinate synthase